MLIRRLRSGEHFELKSGERITNLSSYTISLLFTYPEDIKPEKVIHQAEEYRLLKESDENQTQL